MLTDYQSADTIHSINSADRWPFHSSTCAIVPNSLLFSKQTPTNYVILSSACAVNWKPGTQIHGCLKNLYWKWFWCCTPLQTLSAFCKSPSNSKQRQDPSQVSCGAASPACLWTWLGNSWVGTTCICLSFTPAPSLPSPKMFPETAQSSSVLSHQHPCRIINHSRGSHRNKVWTFLFWFSGLFVCGFSFLRERPCVNPACIVSFLSVVSPHCWIYQPVSQGFEINTINSAFNPAFLTKWDGSFKVLCPQNSAHTVQLMCFLLGTLLIKMNTGKAFLTHFPVPNNIFWRKSRQPKCK